MDDRREAVYRIAQEMAPATVRQIMYRAVVEHLFPKDASGSTKTYDKVQGVLGDMRVEGAMPYEWVVDESRSLASPGHFYDSLADLHETVAHLYDRNHWQSQPERVEVWTEKEGVLWPVTAKWNVPLLVCHGRPSITVKHDAVECIMASDKRTTILYVGDHDPTGVDSPREAEEWMRTQMGGGDTGLFNGLFGGSRSIFGGYQFDFEVLAVLPEHVEQYAELTRATNTNDKCYDRFVDYCDENGLDYDSLEMDAIPANELRRIVEDAITLHIDFDLWDIESLYDDLERQALQEMPPSWRV